MKKIFILLSILTISNIITPVRAELSDKVVPALKIAGGTLAAATAIASGTITGFAIKIAFDKDDEFGCMPGNCSKLSLLAAPTCISATILSAMAFGYTKNMKISTASKIIGGSLLGLSSLALAAFRINDPNFYLPQLIPLSTPQAALAAIAAGPDAYPIPGKIFTAAAVFPTILAVLAFKSAAEDFGIGK